MDQKPRYIGLDVHKRYVMVAGVDTQRTIVLKPQKVQIGQFAQWASVPLHQQDAGTLEATGNAWELHDQLTGQVAKVVVANARKMNPGSNRWIAVLGSATITAPFTPQCTRMFPFLITPFNPQRGEAGIFIVLLLPLVHSRGCHEL